MTKQEITDLVNPLIAGVKLKEALQSLSTYVKGKDRYLENDLLMQTASFNRNHHDYFVKKLISKSDYDIAVARLNYALTQIIERLPETGNDVEIPENTASSTEGNSSVTTASQIRKILFLSANPKDADPLRLGEELRKIKDSLALSTDRDQFDLESESAVQIPTITRAMQQQNPEIVHFSGHGTGEEGIMVEDAVGEAVYFPTNGLNRLFRRFKDKVKCVVLNACFSYEQAEVISKHGIYVVGMNKEVGDEAAINFAVGFYQSLGEGNDYEFAYDIAMINIAANLSDANTPELWLDGEKLDI